MKNKNLGGKHWAALDYNVASDYTHGSPEYYRSLLRQITGKPKFLPGEKSEIPKQGNDNKRPSSETFDRRNLSNIFYQG